MANYIIVEADSIAELESKVNKELAQGYEIVGALVIKQVMDSSQNANNGLSDLWFSKTKYMQTMLNTHYTK